jgi:hypothetical protein
MPGRHILEGVLVLHETIHEIKRKKLDGVILKLDFEKAYDKVKWGFLKQVLRMKGFHPKWCLWIEQFVSRGSVGIKVNDDIGHYFQTKKGLRQGDPLSPTLFNIIADILAILIARAKEDGQIGGLIPHLVEGGVSILQYADDTILFLEHDVTKAMHLKLILSLFEQLSGLKINYHKSEVFCFGKALDEEQEYTNLFGCEAGSLPLRYLGIPIHYRKLKNSEWKSIEDRFEKKLHAWVGKLLSYGDRLILINSVLTSLPMFMLSFFEIPKGVRKRLDFFRSRFFWEKDSLKKKYRLTKWNIICRPKDQGGLGIEVLDIKNKCLLSKWLYKILHGEGLWHELIHNKYLHSKTLSHVEARDSDSPFWKGLMKVKDNFFRSGHFQVGNGRNTLFWEDTWLGNEPLATQYADLYNIVQTRHATVAQILSSRPLNIRFRRSLTGNKWYRWLHLVSRIMDITLTEVEDFFVWDLTSTGVYSVKSFYLNHMNSDIQFLHKYIWKLKVPLKIRIFMWFLHRKVILTKDNLFKRKWKGDSACCFCNQAETIQHLFFSCPLAQIIWRIVHFALNIPAPSSIDHMFGNWLTGANKSEKRNIRVGACALLWAIWNTRNDYIFNKQNKSSFLQVIPRAVHWIRMWSFLQPKEQRQDLASGCSRLEMVARDLFNQCSWRPVARISF